MVKVGLIGVGSMGRSVAKLVQQNSTDINFSALYDPDESSVSRAVAALDFDGKVCATLDELLATDCSWVMIASWNSFHATQAVAAFEAGKHVFCQKPLAINLEDCLAMRDAWVRSDNQFVIGFTLRFSPHYRHIKSLIDSGAIGKIVSIDFNETLAFNHGGYIMGDWRRMKENAGSHVLEKCSHDIDIVNWLVDSRAAKVASFGGLDFFVPENETHIQRLGVDQNKREAYLQWRGLVGLNPFSADKNIVDNQVVILEYENHVRASFHMNSNAGIPERRLYICGTEGAIRSDVLKGSIELQKIGFETELEDHSVGVGGMHGEGDGVLAEELVMAMHNNPPSGAPGIQEGLTAAATCFGIDEALESGEVVSMQDCWAQVDIDAIHPKGGYSD